ncbi:MAG: sugar transferase, partial [Chloroflexi bacterium]|nr:sugar transferase [Chloroflexota bacterium]
MDLSIVILSSPVWLFVLGLCALLIKLEEKGGNVIFYQERTGKGGRRFRMYKFRTMVMNAEEMKTKLAHLNELQWPDFKITDDPRITKIGRFLRKTSLDELPQILNILIGEMSLVGPRPTSF